MTDALKQHEESKRERRWNPRERWQVLQRTMTWAELQPTVGRNTPSRCLAEQARKLRCRPLPDKPADEVGSIPQR